MDRTSNWCTGGCWLVHSSQVHLPINVVIDEPIGEGSCILLYLAKAVNPTPF
jgi:hypothetical protein